MAPDAGDAYEQIRMARTVPRLRSDGVVRIRRVGRWRWVWLTLGGLAVVLPLALSLAFVLPPVILAIPPMVLWVAIWMVFRHLDDPSPAHPTSPSSGKADVIPMRHRRSRARA